jgi:hypothetical protein
MQKNIKIALIALCLSLMLLIEPASAKMAQQKGNKLTGQKSRQPAKNTANNKFHQSTKASGARRKASRPANSAVNKPILQNTKTQNRSNAVNYNLQQPHRTESLRSAAGTTEPALFASKFADTSFNTQNLTWQNRQRDCTEPAVRQWKNPAQIQTYRHRSSYHYPYKTCNRITWPSQRYFACSNRGPHFRFGYFHPHHRRNYIFIGLGGYWPAEYSYVRYGCYPYKWYGCYPTTYDVWPNTCNYYIYNYNDDNYCTGLTPSGIRPANENTFADVRERLAAQATQQTQPETPADKYFEDAVKAFEAADYDIAAAKLAEAINLEPDDIALPFAYVQALFADRQFTKAAEVLRNAIDKLPSDSEAIFYPSGLYPDDDDILFEQIGRLAEKTELCPLDDDLQLLLGYQFLGAGKLDRAEEYLQKIASTSQNSDAMKKLLEILEKARTENTQDE